MTTEDAKHLVYRLNKEMEAAHALREALATDDSELIRDMIEGETSLREMIGKAIESYDEDTMLEAALKTRIAELRTRADRIVSRIATKRAAIEQAMVMAEVKTLEYPTLTATAKRTAPGLRVTDESAIPADYWRSKDPVLDKRALKDALKDGQTIPGVELDNGGVALQIRRN